MKKLFRIIKQDKIIYRSSITTSLIILVSVIYSLLSYSNLPPVIPLFNQLPWGEKRLTFTVFIFLPSLLALTLLVLNILITRFIYEKTPLIARILTITSLLIGIFSLLLIIRTITIVT